MFSFFLDIILGFGLLFSGYFLQKSIDTISFKSINNAVYLIMILMYLSAIGRFLSAFDLYSIKFLLGGFQIIVVYYLLKLLITNYYFVNNGVLNIDYDCEEEIQQAIEETKVRTREEIYNEIMMERA